MSKFKVGDKVRVNNFYFEQYKETFNKICKRDNKIYTIKEVCANNVHQPIYFFEEPDKQGNRDGMAESFLELVK